MANEKPCIRFFGTFYHQTCEAVNFDEGLLSTKSHDSLVFGHVMSPTNKQIQMTLTLEKVV